MRSITRAPSALRRLLLLALALPAAACTDGLSCGSGTHAEGDVCVPDDGTDGGAGADSGRRPDGEGTLTVGHEDIRLGVGLMLCLDVELVGRERVPVEPAALDVTIDDPAVAALTDMGDCAGLGILALADGSTELAVTHGDETLQIEVRVRSTPVELRWSLVQTVAEGEEAPWGCGAASCPVISYEGAPFSEGATIVPRLMTVSSDAPDIATIAYSSERRDFVVSAHREGRRANITGTYRGYEALFSMSSSLISVRGAVAERIAEEVVLCDGAVLPNGNCVTIVSPARSGDCYDAHLLETLRDESGAEWTAPSTNASYELSPNLTGGDGTDGSFCIPSSTVGEFWVRGCQDGVCLETYSWAFPPEGYAELVVDTQGPHTATPDTEPFCPTLRVTLVGHDGSRQDITGSRALIHWDSTDTPPESGYLLTPHREPVACAPSGRPCARRHVYDMDGDLCFLISAVGGAKEQGTSATFLLGTRLNHSYADALKSWDGLTTQIEL